MITNERQFRIAKDQMEKFKLSITNLIWKALSTVAQLDQLQTEYEILLEQIKEYESLSSSEQKDLCQLWLWQS